jgi:hypothetical protein
MSNTALETKTTKTLARAMNGEGWLIITFETVTKTPSIKNTEIFTADFKDGLLIIWKARKALEFTDAIAAEKYILSHF